jgi:hypothetical protein
MSRGRPGEAYNAPMRSRWLVSIGLVIGCLGLAGCGEEEAAPVVTVELDVFSGRPNPSWVLSASDAREVQGRLADLPVAGGKLPDAKLGYRGFYLTVQDCHGVADRVQVTSGLVERGGQVFQDARGAEDRLIELAGDQGYAPLIRAGR